MRYVRHDIGYIREPPGRRVRITWDDVQTLDDVIDASNQFTDMVNHPPTQISLTERLLWDVAINDDVRRGGEIPDLSKRHELCGMAVQLLPYGNSWRNMIEMAVLIEDDLTPWKICQMGPQTVINQRAVVTEIVKSVGCDPEEIMAPETATSLTQKPKSIVARFVEGAKLAIFGHDEKKPRRQPEREPDWFKQRHCSMEEFNKKYGGK